jgi:aldehyde dehydrogenase (NAD+)
MAHTLVSVIGGRPAEAAPAATISSPNPSRTSDVVAEVALADAATFAAACAAAKRAQPSWADVPAPVRGRVAGAIGRIVEANKDSLARLVTRELGKPYPEALGEVQEIIDTCDFFLGEGRRLYGQTVPSEMPDKQLFTFRVPVGAVAVLTAGNFPVAVPSWYLIPALVAGNTVVWKPAEYAAASAMALFELIQAAGLPDGVLNIVFAEGRDAFAGLELGLQVSTIDKIGFTGSTAVGSRIGELAAATCRPLAWNSAARTRWW